MLPEKIKKQVRNSAAAVVAFGAFSSVAVATESKPIQETPPLASAVVVATKPTGWREEFAYSVGIQAYIYAFPLIYMSELRYKWANDSTSHPYTAPNHLYHFQNVTDATYKDGGSPNNETLYSWGFLDVNKEPIVVAHPDMGTRYFNFQMVDMYADNFGYIGKLTTGSKAGAFLIAGPDWKGKTPPGIKKVIRSRTPSVLVIGRTFVEGPEDVAAVNSLQQQYRVVPMSLWGKKTAVVPEHRDVLKPFDRTNDPLADWKTINQAMDENPPTPKDAQLVRLFADVGVGPGQSSSFDNLNVETKRGLERAAIEGRRIVQAMATQGVSAKLKQGWLFTPRTFGHQGLTDEFGGRAACSKGGIACNDAEEAVYFPAYLDADGEVLNSANRYTLRFKKGGLPPVNEFWSVTMYGPDFNLVDNPLNRYAIRDRTPGIKQEADGSTIFYLQPDSPGADKESNWLPTPKAGRFSMLLRAYAPKEPILNQTWSPPLVEKAHF